MSLKRMFSCFKTELVKMYTNISFYVMVIFSVIIFMSNTIYTDIVSSKTYNMFQVIGMRDRKEKLSMAYVSFEQVFLGTINGYMSMFAPVLVTVPFVILFSNARKNTNVRYEIFRIGKKEYAMGKLLSAMVCGGSILMTGYLIYGFVASYVLPPATDSLALDSAISGMIADKTLRYLYGKIGMVILYLARLLELFFYGMTSVALTVLVSAFVRNKYLVLCIPFMINYFWLRIMEKYIVENNARLQYFLPSYPAVIFHCTWDERKKIFLFWTCFIVCILVTYYYSIEGRCDCGE